MLIRHLEATLAMIGHGTRTVLLVILALGLPAAAGHPSVAAAAPDLLFAPAPSVFGQTGVVSVNSAEVLSPWKARVGIMASLATGSGGNRFDLLLTDQASRDKVLALRGSLALGLPRNVEAAVTVPYAHVEIGDQDTDSIGSMTVSTKLRVRDQSGWMPATAVSASWIADTGRQVATSSVSTNEYLVTVSTQVAVGDPEWASTIVAELGGFWRDPGRPEADSSLVYGVAGVVPLGRTGLLEDTGEYQFLAEVNGTSTRQDVTQEPDDTLSVATGFRYLGESGGVTAVGILSRYEGDAKKRSAGGLVEWHVVF